jgi:predicted membrane channel-forming protein YqfA (hemolysin III family)
MMKLSEEATSVQIVCLATVLVWALGIFGIAMLLVVGPHSEGSVAGFVSLIVAVPLALLLLISAARISGKERVQVKTLSGYV